MSTLSSYISKKPWNRHTSGNWEARQRAGKPFVTRGNCTRQETIATIQTDNMQDAYLIAAAPLMKSCLEMLLVHAEDGKIYSDNGKEMIFHVLKKALGENNA